MAKEKANLYEEVEFGNNYEYVMQVKTEAEEKLQKIEKIWGVSIIGSVCGAVGLLLQLSEVCSIVAFVVAIICYRKVGGLGTALRWSWNLAKVGWYIIPYFPLDLIIGFGALGVGLLSLFFMPFFVVRHLKKQETLNLESADAFLRIYQQEQETVTEN